MNDVSTNGLDLAKNMFEIYGADANVIPQSSWSVLNEKLDIIEMHGKIEMLALTIRRHVIIIEIDIFSTAVTLFKLCNRNDNSGRT